MKTCMQCGGEYGPRKREGVMLFERRLYCSKRCAGLATNPRKSSSEFAARYRQITTPDGRKMLEHRWVMEQVLGRPLQSDEQVHHKNRDRLDNRPENLEVVSSAEHGLRHTVHPITKSCVVCGQEFTPHKTKRVRAQTCGPSCKSVLMSRRNAERKTA